MPYATYTRQMLADFTGRPLASFPDPFVTNSVIPQALLLFKIGTCLASPDDLTTDQKQLVDYAVLAMADDLHLKAPYAPAMATPFQHESIGSYSYALQRVLAKVQEKTKTGVAWFDLAIDQLSVCDDVNGSFAQGGIEVWEHDGRVTGGPLGHQKGNHRFLSPKDLNLLSTFGMDPAPGRLPFGLPPFPENWVEDNDDPGLYFPE